VGAVRVLGEEGGRLTLRVEGAAELRPAIVRALVAAELDVLRIDKGAERLESIFLKLTHGKEAA
jgi:ABC-2 type transport system ATP-binding protein